MTDADNYTFHHFKYCVFCCSEFKHLYGPCNDADWGDSRMAPQPGNKAKYC